MGVGVGLRRPSGTRKGSRCRPLLCNPPGKHDSLHYCWVNRCADCISGVTSSPFTTWTVLAVIPLAMLGGAIWIACIIGESDIACVSEVRKSGLQIPKVQTSFKV